MTIEDIGELAGALRSVVETAFTKGLAPTESEHAVIWWEPNDDHGSTGKTEIRKTADIRSVARMLHAEPSMAQLRAIANDIRKIKWPDMVVDETAENIRDFYFSAVGSVAIDEPTLRQKLLGHVMMMDRFFATLKKECIHQTIYTNRLESVQLCSITSNGFQPTASPLGAG
jgi:hypothetical protein